jgi:HAD superfamily hydrolase (TIGR01490 family)
MRLILFDLDNTLLAGDSDAEWARFLINKGLVDADTFQAASLRFQAEYQVGTLDIEAYLRFQLSPLTQHSSAHWALLHQEFMQIHIMPIMTEKGLALVKHHQAAEDRIVMITATNRFITEPIAHTFHITELIAVEIEEQDGRYTGHFVGVPSYQQGKVTRLDQWLQDKKLQWADFTETWFYSDSFNDLPLLKRVSHPVAVDPDKRLQAYALTHQWPIISLR